VKRFELVMHKDMPRSSGKIAVIGGVLEDASLIVSGTQIIKGRLLLPEQQKVIASHVDRSLGGGAFNVSLGLARLGHAVTCIAAIGSDPAGQAIREQLALDKIRPVLSVKKFRTGLSVVIKHGAENWVLGDRGANDLLDWKNVAPGLRGSSAIVISHLSGSSDGILKNVARHVSKSAARPLVCWNPGITQFKRGLGSYKKILGVSDILVCNQSELLLWTKQSSLQKAMRALRGLTRGRVVVTLGAAGAIGVDTSGEVLRQSALSGKKVDTLGAGDSFVSGLMHELLLTRSLKRALKVGMYTARQNLSSVGSARGLATKAQVLQFSRTI
jgi:sugar/nucleoside kinase (ribokinase family)